MTQARTTNLMTDEYTIRIPVRMLQFTDKDGHVMPVMFDWQDINGIPMRVKIDRVVSITQQHERRSGIVGDRYECEIDGKRELLYYTKLQPRKWFKVIHVSEEEYNNYFKMPGEG